MGYKKNKFSFLYLMIQFFFVNIANSQTGIGTPSPDASAKLDVYSTNKGFLPPRVTLTSVSDNATIASPATGLLVYNTGTNVGLAAGYYYWNGNAWATIATAGGSGSFAASFLRGSRTASQSVAVSGIVSFSAVDNTSGSDITLSTSDGKITLRPGNTYRLIAAVPNFTGNRPAFMWYNETSSSYIGSATNGYSPTDGASGAGAFGGLAEVIITPSVTTVLSFRLLSSLSSGAITVGGLADFSTTGSYPWFEAQVISGNTPVTGQSVEYGIARYTGADGTSLSTNAIVAFDATATGNLGWSGNKFTLKANKTYELESYLAVYHASAGVAGVFQIYNYTNSTALANGLYLSINGVGGYNINANGPMRCIITPTTDIEVGVRITTAYGGWPSIVGSTSTIGANGAANQSYLLVKQIGSSAIVNPWTLSGTDTYNTTGNVGIGVTSPMDKLVVGSSIALHDGGDKVIGMGWSPGSGKAILAGYPAEIRLNPSSGKLSFGTDPTTRSVGSTPSLERRMTITSGGQVGIGTENPGATLEIGSSNGSVPGSLVLNPTTTGTGVEGAEINFRPAPVTTSPAAQTWVIDQVSNGNSPRLRFFPTTSGETYGFTIKDNGYLGIGTGTPSNKLHVQSSDGTSVYIESTTSDNNGMLILNANTNQNWSNNWHEFIYFRNQGNNIGGIIASNGGNMVSYGTTSDYRLKRDLREFSGLDLVNKIKTYDFAWRRDSSRMFGVMAHELQAILPYAVNGQKDALDVNGKTIPQSVDYGKLTPILVKAIQEQDVIIKEQVEKLIKLSKEKDSIEKRVSDLELLIKNLMKKNN